MSTSEHNLAVLQYHSEASVFENGEFENESGNARQRLEFLAFSNWKEGSGPGFTGSNTTFIDGKLGTTRLL